MVLYLKEIIMLSWITLVYFLELGFSPVDTYVLNQEAAAVENSFYTILDADIVFFDTFFIGGNAKTNFVPSDGPEIAFKPFLSSYSFRVGIQIQNVIIGYEHLCIHPVSYQPWRLLAPQYGGHDRIFVRIASN